MRRGSQCLAAANLSRISTSQIAVLVQNGDRVRGYLECARARNTIRGYRFSFQQFQKWCTCIGLDAMPANPETIAMYLSAQAGRLKASTLNHHLAAISKAHKSAGYQSPVKDNQLIAETMKGIKRTHGCALHQMMPILTEDLRLILRTLPRNVLGVRDRALLLIGFAGAFRRSELVGLDVADLSFGVEGLLITLRRSKTDQDGEGRQVAIPGGMHEDTCPVRALQAWLQAAGIGEGPVFRPINRHGRISANRLSGHAVGLVVKRCVGKAGITGGSFGGHSLRAGFVTSAARAGAPERQIMRTTGHKSLEMLGRYIRQANAFTDNAVLALGL